MRLLGSRCSYTCFYLVVAIGQVFCRTCPPLKSESVDIVCEYEGDVLDCESPLVRGTKALLRCKDSYKIPLTDDPGYRELTCLNEGVWDLPLFNCIPECGTAVANGKPFVVNGHTAKLGAFPWHVAVYQRNGVGPHEQICGGTLVSPDLVISAAHCFYNNTLKSLRDARDYSVAAGKFYRSYDTAEDFAEYTTVKKIDITDKYRGHGENYREDIALVRLNKPFTLTTLIRPVCMDWNNEYERDQLQGGKSGKIVGWGRTQAGIPSPELQEIDLPFIYYEKCIRAVPENFRGFITRDKFCAGHLNGSSLCDGDSGGGLCFKFNGRWYLRGIASVGPADNNMCDQNSYTAFTNVGNFLDWIRKVYFNAGVYNRGQYLSIADTTTATCILPEQPPGGSFRLGSCKGRCSTRPGSKVPIGSYLAYKCNEGYTLSGNDVSFCHEAGWYTPPTCVVKVFGINCPALRSKTVDITCTFNGVRVPCQSSMAPGTRARLVCKEFYQISFVNDPGYRDIACLEDGVWNNPVFQCTPECGTLLSDGTKLMADGSVIERNKFPWRVFLYEKNSTAPFAYKTDSTLISSDLVIVHPSRLFGDVVTEVTDLSNLVAVAGKYYQSYDSSVPYAQESRIKSVDLAKGYNGRRGNYAHNIALLRLETPFTMSALVRPICMDWDEIVGSSANENQNITDSYIPSEKCRSQVIDNHKPYITDDTICTDCKYDVGICSDVGQGGAFGCESNGLWYLSGRYKMRPKPKEGPCDLLYSYTKIGAYLNWIRAAYEVSVV